MTAGERAARPAPDAVLGDVLALVSRVAGARRTPAETGPGTPLGEGGFWLDSVEFLEVVVACEEQFGLVFDLWTEVTPAALRTAGSLAELVRAKGRG